MNPEKLDAEKLVAENKPLIDTVTKMLATGAQVRGDPIAQVFVNVQRILLNLLVFYFKNDFRKAHTVMEMVHEGVTANLLIIEQHAAAKGQQS